MTRTPFFKSLIALIAPALVAAACAGREANNSVDSQKQNPVKRTGPLAPVDSTAFSLAGGPIKGKSIVVDLETTPDPTTSWGTTACLPVLAPDFELGRATCSTGETRVLTAAMAKQICSTDPNFGPAVAPTAPIGLDTCSDVTVAFYGFTPALNIQIVQAP